ncbi:Nin one binding (NOB1) Zn-ribbon-like [Dillenia turbinata]|uniref:Nin one binding (NOB1) Zn-ribbon-like n=1 Tax=Dillenia turbinata TaxID=194707 RepID=A0AAN8ZER0_9MAGN
MEVPNPNPNPYPNTNPNPSSCWSNIVKKQPSQPQPSRQPHVAVVSRLVESCKSSQGIAVAVVDANAIIEGGEKLYSYADKFVSVPEVMDEVRDSVSRHKLSFVPFSIDTTEPSPDALKKVISFARATGDLQTLSDVDLKLIALTYTLEAQIHGIHHLRDSPPPVHLVNVRRLPEKDLPGWGSNVPNIKEWEALEQETEDKTNLNSRILPLKDVNLNNLPADDNLGSENGSAQNGSEVATCENQEDFNSNLRRLGIYPPNKREVKIEGKKMVAAGIDASQGHHDDNASDWMPSVCRSTHRRYLRRKARREMAQAQAVQDGQPDEEKDLEADAGEDAKGSDQLLNGSPGEKDTAIEISEDSEIANVENGKENLSSVLRQMRLAEDSAQVLQGWDDPSLFETRVQSNNSVDIEVISPNGASIDVDGDEIEKCEEELDQLDISSQTNESVDASYADDASSEQSWMLRSLSDSSVACITSDFAMQNVILQMGLRLLAPGGMQIRQLHRWVLKCHACNEVTAEIGRIFCPKCGNGGTLRRVAVTVGENGIVLAARRPRITLRGTKFSLPLPQGGRDAIAKNPILREDQLPQRLLYPTTKKKSSKQGDDLFCSDDIFCHHTDKKAPLKPPVRKALAVFSQKRNPNDNHYSRPKH